MVVARIRELDRETDPALGSASLRANIIVPIVLCSRVAVRQQVVIFERSKIEFEK